MAVTKNATRHAQEAAKASMQAIKEPPGVKGTADYFGISIGGTACTPPLTEEECMIDCHPRDNGCNSRKTCGPVQ